MRRVCLHHLYLSHHQALMLMGKNLPSLLFCRLNSPSSPSLSWCVRSFNPFTGMAFPWTPPLFVSHPGEPSAGHSAPHANSPGLSQQGHLPCSAVTALPKAAQESCWSSFPQFLAHCQFGIHQDVSFICQAAFQLVLVHGVTPAQLQDFAFFPFWISWDSCQPISQPVPVPLNGSETTRHTSHPSQLCILYKNCPGVTLWCYPCQERRALLAPSLTPGHTTSNFVSCCTSRLSQTRSDSAVNHSALWKALHFQQGRWQVSLTFFIL